MCKPIAVKNEESIVRLYKNTVFIQSVMSEESPSKGRIEEISAECSVELPEGGYRVVVMNIDHAYKADASYENMRLVLTCLINEVSCDLGYTAIVAKVSDKDVLALLYERPRRCFGDIEGLFGKVMGRFLDLTGCTVTVGVSSYFSAVTDIPAACAQAEKALSQKIFLGNNRVITYKNTPDDGKESPKLLVNDLRVICEEIRNMNTGGAKEIIRRYFEGVRECRHVSITDVKNTVLMLVMLMMHDEELGAITENAFGSGFDPAQELARCEILGEVERWTMDITERVGTNVENYINRNYSPMVREAIIFTIRNFNKSLTTGDVAEHLHVSPNHFMRMFKKELGTTYGDYLAEHRMVKAKKLLKTNKYKIYEVADKVGYQNTAYFNRMFKKYTGHNPGYYCKGGDREVTA